MSEALFTPYDRECWPRAGHYEYYRDKLPCVNSMTVEADITHVLRTVKGRGLRFYAAFICLTGLEIASQQELCMGLDEQGNPGYYSFMNPNFTVFHQEDHTFSDLWSDFSGDFHAFYRNVTEDMERYRDCRGIKPKSGQPRNFFCISCVPWCSYSAYSTFQYGGSPNLFPIVTFGRYRECGGRVSMPVTLTIGHAAADGYHMSLFFEGLQQRLDSFAL